MSIQRGAPPPPNPGRKRLYDDLLDAAMAEPGEWFSQETSSEDAAVQARNRIRQGRYRRPDVGSFDAATRTGHNRLWVRYSEPTHADVGCTADLTVARAIYHVDGVTMCQTCKRPIYPDDPLETT